MFAHKGKFDSKVLLDTGPVVSQTRASLSEMSFVNGMDQRIMETCADKSVPVLSEETSTEPDSSVNYADENSLFQPTRKNVKSQSQTVSTELCSSIESIERVQDVPLHKAANALDRKSMRKADVETNLDRSSDPSKTYVASIRSGCNVISEPIETSIIQNVSKLPKNYTFNVGSGVNNLATIQNVVQGVSSGNQTLWLPTIITSSTIANTEDHLYEDEVDIPPTTVPQFFLAGTGQHFSSHSVNNSLMSSSKSCHISNHKFPPKVQILGGIAIPKHNSATAVAQSNVASNIKSIHANYLNQSEISNVNSCVTSSSTKQMLNNSILNQMSNKMHPTNIPFVGARAQSGPVQVKCSSVINSANFKGIPTAVNRSLNKIHNNNNNNTKIESSTVLPDQSGHVFSRVIPAPKISLQSTGRVVKSGNIQYGQKPGNIDSQQTSNIIAHKVQSAMPVKILQQQTIAPGHKASFKTVQTARATVSASKNLTYSSLNLPGKSWSQTSSQSLNHMTNQRPNSSFTKNITSVVNVKKVNCKNPTQNVLLHQPSNQMIVSNAAQMNRINSQHYQQPSGDSGNALRYVQNYMGMENSNSSTMSSNQNLTAQILQSLSQPKILLPTVHHVSPTTTANRRPIISNRQFSMEDVFVKKSFEQKRQIHGDPNTVLTTDDILGTEERPTLSDDSLPYHYHSLQLVMLDHTYAVSPQTISSNTVNGTSAVTSNSPPVINNNITVSSPVSTTKVIPHSTNTPANGTLSRQSPVSVMPTVLPSNNTPCIAQNVPSYQYNVMPAEDDDAASIISSIEGDRDVERNNERHDSDTETAPEGEEEGKTRCVCEFTHDDGYMICCDKCGEWQHVDCMGIDRQNIPDDYMCDRCEPRLIDRKRARSIQIRKREELTGLGSSGSDSSSGTSITNHRNKQIPLGGSLSAHKKRPLTVTTYSNTISGVSRTVPTLSSFSPPYGVSNASPLLSTKKVPKRSRRIDNGRKGPKRKLPEKRKRKSSEVSNYRTKFCPLSTSHQVNQWSESYELAMTNHYSPELRAKMARYSNRTGNNSPNLAIVLTAHMCTTVPHAGSKILIATKDMADDSPIIELRGKYMLSTQHKPQPQLSSRVGSQRPGPFLFFYRLPQDSTQICIDTRTYGNEARFIRRSCKPNAELQHCIIKGALHVYLVTVGSVQSNTEITIRHDSTGVVQPCACGNPKTCKQPGVNNTAIVHRSNGAVTDANHERRGRTRYSSFSSVNYNTSAFPKYDEFLKAESPEPEKIEEPEPERVEEMKREVIESFIFEKSVDTPSPPVSGNESPVIEKKPVVETVVPETAVVEEPVVEKKLIECVKEEVEIKPEIKEEVCITPEIRPLTPPVEAESEKVIIVKQEEVVINEPMSEVECKSPVPIVSKASPILVAKVKDVEKTSSTTKKIGNSRRTSTHSIRSTRASTSNAFSTCESADEKSDTQSEPKTQSSKEKKKLTREERKMEAIMKAFERMEKAELRRQENRDRQSRRRESDSQPSNMTEKDLKDQQNDDQIDDIGESSLKRRRRKKGRARTVSQSNSQRNRNRLNSIDSDMVTSGEESTSLLSPPVSSNNVIGSTYSDMVLSSSEDLSSYRAQDLSDTIALRESVNRLNVGLSSACLLVEAAVGPLESTFKFPKTKKDMMNEWLNKSPDRNLTYDVGHHGIDYANTGHNNNSTRSFVNKQSFLEEKSLEHIMKATKTIIGTLSASTMSVESTPEKNFAIEQSEPENLATFNSVVDSSGSLSPSASPLQSYFPKIIKKIENDGCRELTYASCEKRVPKRFRKGFRSVFEEHCSPIKRSLRSNAGTENVYNVDPVTYGNVTPPHDESNVVMPAIDEIRDVETLSAPQPPQHSAKKRWLRQAISEESDSPTAESPPNEMVTPLKKRRLARESLSMEPPFVNCEDTPFSGTLKKDANLIIQNAIVPKHVDSPQIIKSIELKVECPPTVDLKSNVMQDLTPSVVQDFKPNILQDLKPSVFQNLKPIVFQDFKPTVIPNAIPNAIHDLNLIVHDLNLIVHDFKPSGGVHDLKPSPVHDLKPSGVQDLKPSPVHDLKPSPVHDLKPSPVHDLKPSPVHDLKLSPVHDLKPSVVHDLKPSVVHDLKPSVVHDLKQPSAVQDLKLSTVHVVKPNTVHDLNPSAVHILKPNAVQDLKPSAVHVLKPSVVHDLKPSVVHNFETNVVQYFKPCIYRDSKLEITSESSTDNLKSHSNTEAVNDGEYIKEHIETEVVASPIKKDENLSIENDKTSILSDLKFNLSQFSKIKGNKGKIDSKDDACLENMSSNIDSHDLVSRDVKSEPVSNINSAETSGNSSPVLDDIDDIKKKIHSFHTENIQILKIRNKKQPKEKRKKVNLNFDLCVLDDQTVGVKLKSEREPMMETPRIEIKPFEVLNKESPETPSRPLEPCKTTPDRTLADSAPSKEFFPSASFQTDNSGVSTENIAFKCASLYSDSFTEEPNPTVSQMPDINVIKNAIDMTIGFKSNSISNSVDEYKNVQEILSHVNQMDSRNSVLLSGLLRDTNRSTSSDLATALSPSKMFIGRLNDPRLNPPPAEAPKPIRRKLSISEYRRRHSMASNSSTEQEPLGESSLCQSTSVSQDSNCNSNLSCVSDEIGKSIEDSISIETETAVQNVSGSSPKSMDDVSSVIGCFPIASEVSTMEIENVSLQLVGSSDATSESSPKSIR
ncbi:SET domain-containing protein upSET [Arctopsyche grandis]|uniref:SET domain-containing protein upSET n=1 Tax=Arctopsyche grandis TaxID=121162 RepID=UPI00406D781F